VNPLKTLLFMKTIKQLTLLVILSGISFILTGCKEDAKEAGPGFNQDTWDLAVQKVALQELPKFYSASGSVVSDQRIGVATRTTGFIRKILVREGEQVIKGQDLIQLDNSDVEDAIRQAQAALGKANSALKDAEMDLARDATLIKSGTISKITLRKTRLQRDLAKDSLDEARAAFSTARAQRQYTQISCPLAGVVVSRHKREGDLAVPGTPILTVESNTGLLLETDVVESRVGKLKQADSVQVTIDALDEPLTGAISRIVPSGDPLTRRYKVKIALPEEKGLLPGMFGRAHFLIGTEVLPIIPQAAMVERGGLHGVFVVDDNSRAYFRWLRTGRNEGSGTVVRAGLTVGERFVAIADARIREGDLIHAEGQAGE